MAEPIRRRRRWLQISLRTYLMISLLGGVGLWCAMYWLREYWPHLAGTWGPPPSEVALPGGWTAQEFRRQATDPKTGEKHDVRDGRYALVDQHDYTRLIGWYDDDLATGTWTYYHDNGRRAMQGECQQGVRTGLWTAWHESGYRHWEIEHSPPPDNKLLETLALAKLQRESNSVLTAAESLTSMSAEEMATLRAAVRWRFVIDPLQNNGQDQPELVAVRHGTARTWRDSGYQESEGRYRYDRRHGPWTFYDESGKKAAAGDYEHGVRRGAWTEWNDAREAKLVYFAQGERITDLAELDQRLAKALADDDVNAAIGVVSTFGRIGADVLEHQAPAVESGNAEIVSVALREVIRLGRDAAKLSASLRRAERSHTGTANMLARLALASSGDADRESLLTGLLKDPEVVAQEFLFYECVFEAGPDIVPDLESLLASDDQIVRRRAVCLLLQSSLRWDEQTRPDNQAPILRVFERAQSHKDPFIATIAARWPREAYSSRYPGAAIGFLPETYLLSSVRAASLEP